MVASLSPAVLASLVAVAFLAGVGNTGVGVGGVFVTAALYAFTDLPSEAVAGTALATFAATGALGSYSYVRSGELRGEGRRLAALLGAGGGVGVLGGVALNDLLPTATVESLFGAAVAVVGVVVAARELAGLRPVAELDPETATGGASFVAIGAGVGLVSGLLGIGGLAAVVPALALLGVPLLVAIGVGQVVSGLLSLVGAAGFALRGAVEPALVLAVGVPELAGALVGWRLAHVLPERPLSLALSAALVLSGGYVLLG
ncbi:sulfite exporter TauE/SafE family protein [Halogeometricum luteum]|uniref:Probable membrane transporter protein n=1 Tax=Halogeometricum luteum TaxID=2950537 RepID=A0ABU2G112_9EURY|nr:sulfite exporter TauE/SafE family protein [Halogeometricum sp. S3BR5-2]MDS0293858.1 sulfite exporter TauE/SafE family protein [Halogeometricum sp. S3BR5-2]